MRKEFGEEAVGVQGYAPTHLLRQPLWVRQGREFVSDFGEMAGRGKSRGQRREKEDRDTRGVCEGGCSVGSCAIGANRENHHQGVAAGPEDSRNVQRGFLGSLLYSK